MELPTVFIGSSTTALPTAEAVKTALKAVAEPVIWNDESVFGLGAGTLESLIDALDRFDYAVLLMTPDDLMAHSGQPVYKPRDNIMIEFGLFVGALGRDRAVAMRPFHEPIHIPTDLAGVTVAPLKPSTDPTQKYDVTDGCKTIAATIKKKGRRPRLEDEIGVLYRLINAFTFPHYEDIHVPALKRGKVKYRLPRETFETVDDVVSFLGELLTDYVYPRLNPGQLESMRIYFAYYLGDGIAKLSGGVDPHACWDYDDEGKAFAGEFVIGLANPTQVVSQRDWRVGHAIRGYLGLFPESMCARVFETGKIDGFNDVRKLPQGVPNYKTPDELAVFSFPVEWRSEEGAARIGVITISSRLANSVDDELIMLLGLLANVVGFLFSLYAVRDRQTLKDEGEGVLGKVGSPRGFSALSDSEGGRRFAAEATGLRRVIAEHFEAKLLAERRHVLREGELHFSGE